jgi:Rod binding domain-containing protein
MSDTLHHPAGLPNAAPALQAGAPRSQAGDRAQAEEAAREFESVFLSKMLEGMGTGLTGSVLSGGQAEETWRSFMNDEYAKLISRSGGVGVADAVLKAMLEMQEVG